MVELLEESIISIFFYVFTIFTIVDGSVKMGLCQLEREYINVVSLSLLWFFVLFAVLNHLGEVFKNAYLQSSWVSHLWCILYAQYCAREGSRRLGEVLCMFLAIKRYHSLSQFSAGGCSRFLWYCWPLEWKNNFFSFILNLVYSIYKT